MAPSLGSCCRHGNIPILLLPYVILSAEYHDNISDFVDTDEHI